MSITLKNVSQEGIALEATFLPHKGMNLISYKKGDVEVIDQSTRPLFAERFAGLGALIGPHFHHRSPDRILPIPFEERFCHIQVVRERGIKEPISHGIARYAPWTAVATKSTLQGKISGNDMWEGVLLSSFEGFNFTMTIDVELKTDGLFIELAVDAQQPSVVGFHYYFAIDQSSYIVTHDCIDQYFNGKSLAFIEDHWRKDAGLHIPLDQPLDCGLYPKDPLQKTRYSLHTQSYQLNIVYQSYTDESSTQIFHPHPASFVCIEPLSAKYPKKPRLLSSGVCQFLQIV